MTWGPLLAPFFTHFYKTHFMKDEQLIGTHDASTVDLEDEKEVQYWMHRFNVSEATLREVVQRVGIQVDDVVKELEAANRPNELPSIL